MARKEKEIKNTRGLTFVLGASRLGANIASLLNEKNVDIVIVDHDILAFNKLPDSFGGLKLLGDALDQEFLASNDIQNAKRVIIVTDDDNINILVAHICFYIFKIENVYIRLIDTEKGTLLDDTTIKAFYPFSLSKNTLISLMEGEK